VGFFNRKSTDRELEAVRTELDSLKREFRQVMQEWDATQDRVSKVLRRIARERQAAEAAESGLTTEGEDAGASLPLTTAPTPSTRLERIKSQLAERGGKDGVLRR
jgi:predicted  nucleic acid-binding Zn-ribbon protein